MKDIDFSQGFVLKTWLRSRKRSHNDDPSLKGLREWKKTSLKQCRPSVLPAVKPKFTQPSLESSHRPVMNWLRALAYRALQSTIFFVDWRLPASQTRSRTNQRVTSQSSLSGSATCSKGVLIRPSMTCAIRFPQWFDRAVGPFVATQRRTRGT